MNLRNWGGGQLTKERTSSVNLVRFCGKKEEQHGGHTHWGYSVSCTVTDQRRMTEYPRFLRTEKDLMLGQHLMQD